jgi:phosphate:Na+ symporter
MSGNRLVGLGAGAFITALIQSSTATSVMLVSFATSGFLTLRQAMSLILGADIGTTFTVQILSFNLSSIAWLLIILGVGLILLQRSDRNRWLGEAILGFGFLFYGMRVMSGTISLDKGGDLYILLGLLSDHPIVSLGFSAVITALLHSSAAMIGLILSIAQSGNIALGIAIPMVLGANVGTCFTALLGSLEGNTEAKRVAWAHLFFKIGGVLLIYPLLDPFTNLVELTSGDICHQIANAHSIFNIGISFAFLPFLGIGARHLERWIPAKEEDLSPFRTLYIDARAIETPAFAFAQVTREIQRMADISHGMLKDSIEAFKARSLHEIQVIEEKDDVVDYLDREIKKFLTRLGQNALSGEQAQKEMELIYVTTQLEHIGDVIDKNLMELAKKKLENQLRFSEPGWQEISDFHAKVLENFELALSAFVTSDKGLAETVLRHHRNLSELERRYSQTHIERLHKGHPEAIETSSLHFDLLSNLRRINSLIAQIVSLLVQTESKTSS